MTQKELLTNLTTDLHAIIAQAEQLYDLTDSEFNQPPAPEKWSVAACLVHLNYYKKAYLAPLSLSVSAGKPTKSEAYESGWLGNYFVSLMLPKTGAKPNQMNAPKASYPSQTDYSKVVLDEFLAHQRTLLGLLRAAEQVDLMHTKAPVPTVTNWLKLRIGDIFRFLISHEQRHFQQISRVLSVVKGN